ncbi:MAG: methylmalonyl-CoA epimerase [Deltaproteobacteria bacterium]|nr:methylmalonyl-CoA epimerase [Deltaproteobacteria bacterium]
MTAITNNPAALNLASPKWRLDHVAHAVKNLDEGIAHYRNIFGFEVDIRDTLAAQGVEAAYLKLSNSKLELIAPLPGNKSLQAFIERRGEGLHHICFEVPSVAQELKRLSQLGVRLINDSPQKGLGNKDIAFMHPHSNFGVLIEICSS